MRRLITLAKTLHEIRSEACNAILLTLTFLGIPAVGFSLLRGVEQGWRPIMAVHLALLLLLAGAVFRRASLSLTARAGLLVAVPYVVATSGLIVYGRGNGVSMFFITAIVMAGCFFERRIAMSVVALCTATLAAIYLGHRLNIVPIPLMPTAFDMTALSWMAFGFGFLAAGIAPLIGLSALLRLLDTERVRADEATRVRSDFLANMSHELRTPMAGILGMADVLSSTSLTDQQKNLIASLNASARHLLAVLNDVLDFAKFETGRIPIENTPFCVSETLKDICALFEAKAAQRGVALRVERRGLLVDNVVGDSLRIRQVLTNLIDNAVKFTARGAVAIRVEQATRGDGRLNLAFSVIDTGAGIAAENLDRIFEPFIQADMSTSRTHGGTGLGLSICRLLTEAMGGTLAVTSQPGAGSTFTLTVPVEIAPRLPLPGAARAAERTAAPVVSSSPQRIRLLIADDDRNMRTLAEIMLGRRGYNVTIVEDGAAMLALAGMDDYDCFIVDMHMPGMNGPEVMRSIHRSQVERGARITPMIALTADVLPEHVRGFVDAGADIVVGKPVDWSRLDAKIQELVNARPVSAKAS